MATSADGAVDCPVNDGYTQGQSELIISVLHVPRGFDK